MVKATKEWSTHLFLETEPVSDERDFFRRGFRVLVETLLQGNPDRRVDARALLPVTIATLFTGNSPSNTLCCNSR